MNETEYLKYLLLKTEIDKHLQILEKAFNKLETFVSFHLNEEKADFLLETSGGTMVLDQIACRFAKLQDFLRKLIRVHLSFKGENVYHLPISDMEKYELGISLEKWFSLRTIRNALTHEHEEEKAKIASVINRVNEEVPFLEKLLRKLVL